MFKWRYILILLVLIMLIPIAINLGVTFAPNILSGDSETWIGFWGSYLGGIFTLIAVWWTITEAKEQIKIAKEANKINTIKNEKDIIYQTHKDAFDRSMNQEQYADIMLDQLKEYYGLLTENYKIEDEANYKNWLDSCTKLLFDYHISVIPIYSNIENFSNDSLRYLDQITRSQTPPHIINLINHFTECADCKEILKSERTINLHSAALMTSTKIRHFQKEILDELRLRRNKES